MVEKGFIFTDYDITTMLLGMGMCAITISCLPSRIFDNGQHSVDCPPRQTPAAGLTGNWIAADSTNGCIPIRQQLAEVNVVELMIIP